MSSAVARWWFWPLLAASAMLRALRLGEWDLWTDEVQTIVVSQTLEFKEGPMYATAPLNFWITHFVLRSDLDPVIAARFPAWLFGTATVGLVYPLLRRFIGERAALLATGVLGLSMWHVAWSQTARHFALQCFLILLGLHLFLRFWRAGSRSAIVAAPVVFTAALFTHSSSSFYVVALAAFVAGSLALSLFRGAGAAGWRRHVPALILLAVPLAVYAPFYLGVGQYLLAHKVAWNPPTNVIGSLAFYVPPYLALPALAGAAFLVRERDDLGPLLLGMVAIPMILVTLAAQFTIASGAYCLGSMIAVAALAGVACDRMLAIGTARRRGLATALVAAAVGLSQLYDLTHYFRFYNGLKPRWRDASAFVESRWRDDEVFLASEGDVAGFYVEPRRAGWVQGVEQDLLGGALRRSGVGGVWYGIYLDDSLLPLSARLQEHLRDRARVEAIFALHYGSKDRSIVVLHERLDGSDASD